MEVIQKNFYKEIQKQYYFAYTRCYLSKEEYSDIKELC